MRSLFLWHHSFRSVIYLYAVTSNTQRKCGPLHDENITLTLDEYLYSMLSMYYVIVQVIRKVPLQRPSPRCHDNQYINKSHSKVLWQKASSPTCHTSRLRMGSSSPSNGILIGSAFLHSTSVWPTHRQTHRHTDHVTCDICRNRPTSYALLAGDAD